jgi:hypothetical protein
VSAAAAAPSVTSNAAASYSNGAGNRDDIDMASVPSMIEVCPRAAHEMHLRYRPLLRSLKWRARAERLFRHRAFSPLFFALCMTHLTLMLTPGDMPFLAELVINLAVPPVLLTLMAAMAAQMSRDLIAIIAQHYYFWWMLLQGFAFCVCAVNSEPAAVMALSELSETTSDCTLLLPSDCVSTIRTCLPYFLSLEALE